MRFERQFSRLNGQAFSCAFNSGHFAGKGTRLTLSGTWRSAEACQPAWSTGRHADRGRPRPRWRPGARPSPRRCSGAARDPPLCPPWGRLRRRCRPRPCVDRVAPWAGCHVWPGAGRSCSPVRCGLHHRTRPRRRWDRRPPSPQSRPDGRGSLFEMLDRPRRLGMVARARGQLAIVHRAQPATERPPRHVDPELLPQPLAQVDQPPADYAVDGRNGSALDHGHQCCALLVVEPRRLAWRLAADQAIRPVRVALHGPVPNGSQRHASDRRSLAARLCVIDPGPAPAGGAPGQHPCPCVPRRAGGWRRNQAAAGSAWPIPPLSPAFLLCRQP